MEELKQILIAHAKRYPLMQPVDGVKLIYQNEFGGGHLIRDEQAFFHYLRREYAGVTRDPEMPLYEEIGNGIVRVNLAAMEENDLEQLGREFLRSAAEHTGSMDRFLEKLDVLRQVTQEGYFSFGPDALDRYLRDYQEAGCPMVSHSDAYRMAYTPAYRIKCIR